MSAKREVVQALMARGLSERAACRAMDLSRATQRYQPRDPAERRQLGRQIVALAQRHRRYGYRRMTALLRRRGQGVNHKRVWANWKEADNLYQKAIADLFLGGTYQPMEVIKWNRLYDLMERSVDRCADVANVLRGVVLNHA